jgi:hypothetical protein
LIQWSGGNGNIHTNNSNKAIINQGCEISMTIEPRSMTTCGDIGLTPTNGFYPIDIVFRKVTGCHGHVLRQIFGQT